MSKKRRLKAYPKGKGPKTELAAINNFVREMEKIVETVIHTK